MLFRSVVKVDPRYYRPTEVETLLGDPSKAKAKLGWQPTTPFAELVREMVEADYNAARRDSLVKLAGFRPTITTNRASATASPAKDGRREWPDCLKQRHGFN